MNVLWTRRRLLSASLGVLSLPSFLFLRRVAGTEPELSAGGRSGARFEPALPARVGGKARSCIVLYCWGGMSHLDTLDPKPDAPAEIRGEFSPIATAVPGVYVSEHLPRLAARMNRLAVIRSIHHSSTFHGKGMYWNLTGHPPPQPTAFVNQPPSPDDWPTLAAVVSKFRPAPPGVPRSVRLPYPLVDNDTLQAGEYAGFLGITYDPIVMRTPAGREFGGVSRSLGSAVLNLAEPLDTERLAARQALRASFERPLGTPADFGAHDHFRQLAHDLLTAPAVQQAYDLEREDPQVRQSYGDHICGQSLLLARRLTEAGVPIVTVCCAAGDLNGAVGDHWDTHSQNFQRLKGTMLPVFDQAAAALLDDLQQRGSLDETLVVMLTDFGRTPKINGGAGRDHFPDVYSVFLAGGGIRGGQVYGASDARGATPHLQPCSPADVHATIFQALGIPPQTRIYDRLGRSFPLSDGDVLPLL